MIVQVIAPGQLGGLETVVGQLLRQAKTNGLPMSCIALLGDVDEIPPDLAALGEVGISVLRLRAGNRRYLAQLRDLVTALKTLGATIVHTHGVHTDVLGGRAAHILGLPHVTTLHGFIGGSIKSRFYDWLQLKQLKSASAVIGVSDGIVKRMLEAQILPERLHLVPNAIVVNEQGPQLCARTTLGLPLDGKLIGWVGRVSKEKDPEGFVNVMTNLAGCPGIVGVVVGDGPRMESLRSTGKNLIEKDRLILLGGIPNIRNLFSAFDVIVLTSVTEGTPMVVLEAMSAGVPVVATSVGGVPPLLRDGAGFLVPYGDWKQLATEVEKVVTDSSLALQTTIRASQRLDSEYSPVTWWNTHVAIYEALR